MKKLLTILLISIFLLPISIQALVTDSQPDLGEFETDNECLDYVNIHQNNNSNVSGSNFYLACVKRTCESELVRHETLSETNILTQVTCANGNKDFYYQATINNNAHTVGEHLPGQSCAGDPDRYDETPFATQRIAFDCNKKANGTSFVSNTTTTTTTKNNNNNGTVPSPQTGIETYYLLLGSGVVLLSLGIYILNKRNIFKKI